MIKIHAGLLRGRTIKRPNVITTKETASMVREAVFNSLYQINGNVLDLFAGSGSYGITAYSLGATNVFFVEKYHQAFKTISENLNNLKINANLYHMDYLNFLNQNLVKFDYIFLDPPYDFLDYQSLLENVSKHSSDNCYIILEVFKKTKTIESFGLFNVVKNKAYGSKKIVIYAKLQDNEIKP